MPQVERHKPLHLQIAEHYRSAITEGREGFRPDDRFPAIRTIAKEWGVAQNVAQRAVEQLTIVEHLLRTTPRGTFVAKPRAAISPQQRARLTAVPASETVTVLSASLVPMPDYVAVLLGRTPQVIRREQVTRRADGSPHMLSVTWCPPQFAEQVPELLEDRPLPDPRGAGPLIADRTGRRFAEMAGGAWFECRRVLDDGREAQALGLGPDAHVLAGVYSWRDAEVRVEYTEFILPAGQVVGFDLEP
jgi:DNA-binding GntR family transcriptional regulator